MPDELEMESSDERFQEWMRGNLDHAASHFGLTHGVLRRPDDPQVGPVPTRRAERRADHRDARRPAGGDVGEYGHGAAAGGGLCSSKRH